MGVGCKGVKYQPLYGLYLPPKISNSKQGILKIRNEDNKCFLWVVLAQMLPDLSKYKTIVNHCKQCEPELRDVEGLSFPFKIDECFEGDGN